MRGWIVIALALLVALWAALSLGVRPIGAADIWAALTAPDPGNPAYVTLRYLRLPRLCAGLLAGGALGMAGLLMQSLTRNPLADPGILGVNAGAAFAVTLGALLLGRADGGVLAALAFPGAAIAAVAVFALGGGLRGNADPVRLTLAGVACNALLLSLVSAVVQIRGAALDVNRFWIAGSLADATARPLALMAVVAGGAALLALLLAPAIEALTLGAAMSRGLGTHPGRTQAAALLVITLLSGSAVAVAGPIGFLGLMVPPIVRRLVGARLRAGLIASALLGAAILLLADTAGRLIFPPAEIRAGIMMALIGGPCFIAIARWLRPGAAR